MKNTSIFIPLLLIGCLAALIYLFFAALSAAEEEQDSGPDRITLNEADYRDPATDDDAATLDAHNDKKETDNEPDFSDYLEVVPEDEKVAANEGGAKDNSSPATTTATVPARQTAPTTTSRTNGSASTRGRYLVIAGTFRQAEGAAARVASLRAAGFNNARSERFNRGTYAVALAGQYDRYSSAEKLAGEISRKGFEVRVMRRR